MGWDWVDSSQSCHKGATDCFSLGTAEKIADAADLLPADTEFVEIPGATHAQFGDYGTQPGDGEATTTDAEVRAAIAASIAAFLPSAR